MRIPTLLYPLAILFAALAGPASVAAGQVQRSAVHDYSIDTFVSGLERPWALEFLPSGDVLVTEKGGALRMVRNGTLLAEPVSGLPEVYTEGQAGLLDVALHPKFADNALVYLAYSKPLGEGQSTTAIIRGRLEGMALQDVEEVFEAQSRGRGHYGSRLVFDDAGYLFATIGDRQASPSGVLEEHPAQALDNHHGVIVRLKDDGGIPGDNPFVSEPGALPEIWSYGHRNPQGMAFDPASRRLWATEHGPQGGDELNLITAGANYGWPVIGYGVQYGQGQAIHATTTREGMEQPVYFWVPSIGAAGLALYNGAPFRNWQGALLVGGLANEQITLLHMNDTRVRRVETLPIRMGRIRDVVVGPDGLVYLATDEGDGEGAILRLEPVPRTGLGDR